MGDHTETLEIDFDPNTISYQEILHLFWKNHNSQRDSFYKGRQYISILLYHNEYQQQVAEKVKQEFEQQLHGEIQTEIAPYSTFYLAEDYHQKYYLRRFKKAVVKLSSMYETESNFINSTLVARLNGLTVGYGTMDAIKEEITNTPMDSKNSAELLGLINQISW